MKIALISLIATFALSHAKLLLDFNGGDAPLSLGNVELEHQNLGDHVSIASGGSRVFIRPERDNVTGKDALHFHRDSHFRRAEIKMMPNKIKPNKTYYVGYKLRLSKSRGGLVIFQWKKHNKFVAPRQNIPFHLEFTAQNELTLGYTTPGGNGSNRRPRWRGRFSTGNDDSHIHSLGFVINTANDGSGFLEFYLDGEQQTFDNGQKRLKNISLFTGPTSPKIGIYRGEAGSGNDDSRVYDSFVYRVQVSDKSLDEVAEAAGL